jgi:hypothetical protein
MPSTRGPPSALDADCRAAFFTRAAFLMCAVFCVYAVLLRAWCSHVRGFLTHVAFFTCAVFYCTRCSYVRGVHLYAVFLCTRCRLCKHAPSAAAPPDDTRGQATGSAAGQLDTRGGRSGRACPLTGRGTAAAPHGHGAVTALRYVQSAVRNQTPPPPQRGAAGLVGPDSPWHKLPPLPCRRRRRDPHPAPPALGRAATVADCKGFQNVRWPGPLAGSAGQVRGPGPRAGSAGVSRAPCTSAYHISIYICIHICAAEDSSVAGAASQTEHSSKPDPAIQFGSYLSKLGSCHASKNKS